MSAVGDADPALDHAASRAEAELALAIASRRLLIVGIARLLLTAALVVAAFAVPVGIATLGVLALLAGSYGALALLMTAGSQRQDRARLLIAYHAAGLERMAGRWGRQVDTGLAEAGASHPFALDAGVVGERSLFTLVDTSATAAGRQMLLGWLLDDAAAIEPSRSAQARWMSTRHRWRADFYSRRSAGRDGDPELLSRSLAVAPASPWAQLAIWAARAVVALLLAGAFHAAGAEALILLALFLVPVVLPLDRLAKRSMPGIVDPDALRARVARDRGLLVGIASIAELPRGSDIPPELLALVAEARAASAALARCESICDGLCQRGNPIWSGLIGALLLAEWWNLARLGHWTARHAASLPRWSELIARVDALACLGTYVAEQGGCWPEWAEAGAMLDARDLAHPLLIGCRRIGNDVIVEQRLLLIITGANASGKSTFLRACVLAVVLARCGMTVPAASLRLRPMRLATAMDARDDLGQAKSRFQMEVERLRLVLERVRSPGDPVLVALDEVLSGTNSVERHRGTRAVTVSLRESAAAVLISTHDLELAALARDEPPPARVVHFADRAAGLDMAFDYVMRPGVLTTTNALRIMRAAGLPVPEEPGG